MGLDVSVGFLAQFKDQPEVLAELVPMFEQLSQALEALGLAGFREPRELPEEALFSSRVGSYATLHFLRRIAAHPRRGLLLPPAGDEDAPEDDVLAQCYRELDASISLPFDQLLNHSDCEGYYVPIDFPEVVFPPPEFDIAGGSVGSSYRLRDECAHMAKLLELPLGLDPESEDVWSAEEEQGMSPVKWRRYGVESRVCLVLHHAADVSIRYGSAIAFA